MLLGGGMSETQAPEMVAIEIYVEEDPRYNFYVIERLHREFSDAPVTVIFGDYDDDPRELWEIEEVRNHVAELIRCGLDCGIKHWQQDHFRSVFCSQTFSFFMFCIHPDAVRRGESGKYYIFGEGA